MMLLGVCVMSVIAFLGAWCSLSGGLFFSLLGAWFSLPGNFCECLNLFLAFLGAWCSLSGGLFFSWCLVFSVWWSFLFFA